MNSEKINHLINNIEDLLAELKDELRPGPMVPEKIQIVAIWNGFLSYIHYWDPRNPVPRVLFIEKGKAKEKAMTEQVCQAFNMLNNRSYKVGIEFLGDYPRAQLPQMFEELFDLFKVEEKDLTEEEYYAIVRGKNVIHYMQSEPEVSEASGDDLREDRA
jgi:hypothetical protein